MSRRTASVVAWSLVVVSAVLGFTGTGLKLAVDGVEGWHFVVNDVLPIAIFLVSAVVGALIASRLPSNPIGWIFLGLVVALGLAGLTDGYVVLSIDHDRLDGLVPWAAMYAADVFLALFVTLIYTLLLFPNGRLLTNRWHVVFWAATAGVVILGASVVTDPGPLDDYPQITNPAGIDNPVLAGIAPPGFFLFLGSLIAATVSLVLRFRRARGIERQQLTVFMAAGVVATIAFIVSPAFEDLSGSADVGVAVALLGVLAIPVATGVAMLRYRLYEVDRVISRTIVYGALTVILGAAYAGLVLAGQALFASFAGGSNLAIAGSTLVVAALFLPLRARVQRFVDRRFYRRRYDAQRTLEAFGARLREQVALDALRRDLESAVRETMQPAHASVWLREAKP